MSARDEPSKDAAELLRAARQVVDDPARAIGHADAALAVARAAGDARLVVRALGMKATLLFGVCDFDAALPLLEEALAAGQALGDPGMCSDVMNALGNCFGALDRFDVALHWYERAEAAAREAGDARRQLVVAINVACKQLNEGESLLAAGEVERGRQLLLRMVELSEHVVAAAAEAGDVGGEFVARSNRGAAWVCLGETDRGLAELATCVPMAARCGNERSLIHLALYEVRGLRQLGRLDEARAAGTAGLAGAGRQNLRAAAALHEELSLLEEQAQDHAAALAHHRRFHVLHVKALNQEALQRSAVAAARLQAERHAAEAAAAEARSLALSRDLAALSQRVEAVGRDAMTDLLTGLANRRRLDQVLHALDQGRDTERRPMTLALVDVDHFKSINDRFGHSIGDEVLRVLARLLADSTRSGDLAARYGGEEFLIVFDADADAAERVCERTRLTVAAHPWADVHAELQVTISVGVCGLSPHTNTAQAIERADQALYRAKRAGRNRVCRAPPSGGPGERA